MGETNRKTNSEEERRDLHALLAARPGAAAWQQRWTVFVRRYDRLIAACVVKVLRRYGARFVAEDVRDLAGDVWLSLLANDMKKLRQYDERRGCRIATFIGMVATNYAIDRLRTGVFTAPATVELDPERVGEAAPSGDGVEEAESLAVAQAALARLSEKERAFIRQVYEEERDPADIARALGISAGTVYSRKFKLSAKLARIAAALEAA